MLVSKVSLLRHQLVGVTASNVAAIRENSRIYPLFADKHPRVSALSQLREALAGCQRTPMTLWPAARDRSQASIVGNSVNTAIARKAN